MAAASPPDLTEAAVRTRKAWAAPLAEEAAATTDVLLNTLEPYQAEIEHHFTAEGQRRFRGIMGGYLRLVNRSKYVGASLRDKVPFLPKARDGATTPASWDASRFARACSEIAANRQLDARGKALADRLLVEADAQGFALKVLADPVEAASKTDWRQRYALAMSEVLHQVEKQRAEPTGPRRYVQAVLGFLADWDAACRAGLRNRLLPPQGVQRVERESTPIDWLARFGASSICHLGGIDYPARPDCRAAAVALVADSRRVQSAARKTATARTRACVWSCA